MKHEPDSNIRVLCDDCTDKQYPLKGKFSPETIRHALGAKFAFTNSLWDADSEQMVDVIEHMWIVNLTVKDNKITGTLDNEPHHIYNVALGDVVTRDISEVEELIYD
tara:strand:+ start:129 stop:449 length:321 start_codon:yes stop_codon:yes gene_type:complete